MWKMCFLSRRQEADRTGRVSFWSEDDKTHEDTFRRIKTRENILRTEAEGRFS